VNCAKMVEPLEISFRLWTRVGAKKHVLGGVHSGATWRIPLNGTYAAIYKQIVNIKSHKYITILCE